MELLLGWPKCWHLFFGQFTHFGLNLGCVNNVWTNLPSPCQPKKEQLWQNRNKKAQLKKFNIIFISIPLNTDLTHQWWQTIRGRLHSWLCLWNQTSTNKHKDKDLSLPVISKSVCTGTSLSPFPPSPPPTFYILVFSHTLDKSSWKRTEHFSVKPIFKVYELFCQYPDFIKFNRYNKKSGEAL